MSRHYNIIFTNKETVKFTKVKPRKVGSYTLQHIRNLKCTCTHARTHARTHAHTHHTHTSTHVLPRNAHIHHKCLMTHQLRVMRQVLQWSWKQGIHHILQGKTGQVGIHTIISCAHYITSIPCQYKQPFSLPCTVEPLYKGRHRDPAGRPV